MTTTRDPSECRWFAGCTRPAIVMREHGILGNVPICEVCNDTLESWLDQLEGAWQDGYAAGSTPGALNPYMAREQP